MGHCHHSHAHPETSDRYLIIAIGINVSLTLAQVVGGIYSGSLALIADAFHNLSDAASIALALGARRLAQRPADEIRTFGYRKAETIGALISATTLLLIGVYLGLEAIKKWLSPEPILAWPVIAIAGGAFVIDALTAWLTFRSQDGSLNLRAAFIHNLSDAFSSLAVIAAGILVLLYQWYIADIIATILIAGFVIWHAFALLRSSVRILMASVPEGFDLEEIGQQMKLVPGVIDVHHLHLWQLDERHNALEAHVVVATDSFATAEEIRDAVKSILHQRYAIEHSTLELESNIRLCCSPSSCKSS